MHPEIRLLSHHFNADRYPLTEGSSEGSYKLRSSLTTSNLRTPTFGRPASRLGFRTSRSEFMHHRHHQKSPIFDEKGRSRSVYAAPFLSIWSEAQRRFSGDPSVDLVKSTRVMSCDSRRTSTESNTAQLHPDILLTDSGSNTGASTPRHAHHDPESHTGIPPVHTQLLHPPRLSVTTTPSPTHALHTGRLHGLHQFRLHAMVLCLVRVI